MAVIYTAHATATGGREGKVASDNNNVSFKMSKPGSNQEGTNPEELFANGYAACFSGAAQFLAKQQGLDIGDITVKSAVDLHKGDDGFSLGVSLDVSLPSLGAEQAEKLVHDTHGFCPYSKATRGNIPVTLKVNGREIA